MSDPESLEKERARGRDKHHRTYAARRNHILAYNKSPKRKALQDRWNNSVKGQISLARAKVRYRIRHKEARVAELEMMLNA
jgi:hypothetical protein